ncbi:unnamed protein product, partial [Amoebophrya sp. A25]
IQESDDSSLIFLRTIEKNDALKNVFVDALKVVFSVSASATCGKGVVAARKTTTDGTQRSQLHSIQKNHAQPPYFRPLALPLLSLLRTTRQHHQHEQNDPRRLEYTATKSHAIRAFGRQSRT